MELRIDQVAETAFCCNPQRTIVHNGDGPHGVACQPLPHGEGHKMAIRETVKPTSPGPYPELAAVAFGQRPQTRVGQAVPLVVGLEALSIEHRKPAAVIAYPEAAIAFREHGHGNIVWQPIGLCEQSVGRRVAAL
jgi:hypothetical protein